MFLILPDIALCRRSSFDGMVRFSITAVRILDRGTVRQKRQDSLSSNIYDEIIMTYYNNTILSELENSMKAETSADILFFL